MSEVKTKSIKYNFVMNIIFTMSAVLFPLISFPYVTRVLGPVGTGKVSFATSLIVYFNMFAQLGIPTYGIRACAKVRDDKDELTRTVQELLLINLAMSFLAYLVFAVVLIYVPRLRQERFLYVLISSSILLSALGIEWMYKGLECYTYITTRSVFFKFLAFILMFLVIRDTDDYVLYGGLSIFTSVACNILNLFHAHKYISFQPVGGYDFKRHMKPVLVFFAMSCATTVYTHLDTLMIGMIKDDTEVGYYDVAIRIKSILVSLVTSLAAVILPRASYYIEKGKMDEFQRISKKTLQLILLISIPICLYFIFLSKESIDFIAGREYRASVFPMMILMPTLLLIGVSYTTGIQILVPLGKEKKVFYSELGGVVTDIVLNATLIPRYGAVGAAIGTLTAELVVLSIQLMVLRQQIRELFSGFHYFRLLVALSVSSIVCYGCLHFLRLYEVRPIVILLITSVVFFGIYGGYLFLRREPLVLEIIDTVLGKVISKIRKKRV